MEHGLKYFGLVVVLIILCITNSYSQDYKFTPEYSTSISAKVAANLLKQCSRSVPEKVDNYFDLENEDIKKLESDFKKVLVVEPGGCCYQGKIRKLNKYVYQYAGLVINSRKYIYINAFSVDSKKDLETFYRDWTNTPVIVCDGGESFWGVLYDVEKGTFSALSMNGVS